MARNTKYIVTHFRNNVFELQVRLPYTILRLLRLPIGHAFWLEVRIFSFYKLAEAEILLRRPASTKLHLEFVLHLSRSATFKKFANGLYILVNPHQHFIDVHFSRVCRGVSLPD